MSEKVKIPKEVAEAIEHYRERGADNEFLVYKAVDADIHAVDETGVMKKFTCNNFDTFIRALYDGYEVEAPKITLELTPEELGTLICGLGISTPSDIKESGRIKQLSTLPIGAWAMSNLYESLLKIYQEHAGA